MKRWRSFVGVVILGSIVGSLGTAAEGEKPRNPFKVKDVPNPDGEDVKAFATKVNLPGDAKDANAEQWARKPTNGKAGSLDARQGLPDGELQVR